jgi:hypothetical protein
LNSAFVETILRDFLAVLIAEVSAVFTLLMLNGAGTLSRAEALASEFGEGFVASTPDACAATLAKLGRLDYVVCTLPGSTGYVLPEDVLGVVKRHQPIVVEASYIPRHTAFVTQV